MSKGAPVNEIDDPIYSDTTEPIPAEFGRHVIEQAEGAIMFVYGLDEPAAAAVLSARAADTGRTLAGLAARVLAELPDRAHPEAIEHTRARLDRVLLAASTVTHRE